MATKQKVTQKVSPKVTAKVTRTKADEPTRTYNYVVESGIMIVGRRREFTNHFPFEQMKVGDSFLIPKNDPLIKNPNGIHYAVKMYSREVKIGFTVTTRKLLDGTRRVWRIK
jgi:hypothetical protein